MYFLNELNSHVYDTYLIVLIAIEEIIQTNVMVKERNLIEALHFAIISMYNENLLPSLQACHQRSIETALHHFAALNMITRQTYRLENGSSISYMSGSPEQQLNPVRTSQDELIQLQSYPPSLIQEIGKRVQQAL